MSDCSKGDVGGRTGFSIQRKGKTPRLSESTVVEKVAELKRHGIRVRSRGEVSLTYSNKDLLGSQQGGRTRKKWRHELCSPQKFKTAMVAKSRSVLQKGMRAVDDLIRKLPDRVITSLTSGVFCSEAIPSEGFRSGKGDTRIDSRSFSPPQRESVLKGRVGEVERALLHSEPGPNSCRKGVDAWDGR